MTSIDPNTSHNPLHNVKRGPRPQPPRACAIAECDARAYKDNPYCPLHTLRAQRHGDPSVVLKRGPKVREQ